MRRIALFVFLTMASLAAQSKPPDPLFYQNFGDRFHNYTFRTYTDPARLTWMVVEGASDTWWKQPHQWKRNSEGFSYRVASRFGRRIVGNTTQLGLETILHEDSRYRPSGKHGLPKRVFYAIRHSLISYGPDGAMQPAYGRIGAGVVAAAASSTWHPRSISAGALFAGIGFSALDRAEKSPYGI